MNRERTVSPPLVSPSRPRAHESGVALLTVMSLLAVFAIILVGFTLTIRFEENTVQNYEESISVQEAAESAIQGVLAQVARDFDPSSPRTLLGKEQPRYVSLLDPWHQGYAGQINPEINYDARAFVTDTRPDSIVRRQGLRTWPALIPRGIDEDPPGDVTGVSNLAAQGNARGDGLPGLQGIDDNLDGVIDNAIDIDGDGRPDNSPNPEDDDEDFIANEDGYDLRRPDSSGGRFFFAPGTGYDNDGDSVGVFDESAKININFAGNNYGPGNAFTYNLGTGPHELDLEVFLYNRIVQYSNSGRVVNFSSQGAQTLAGQIVNFRNGSTLDGGRTPSFPGDENQDDNNNNNPSIVLVEEQSDVMQVSTFDGEPFIIVGNGIDDDNDGLLNEEDEIYIGPTTLNQSGTPLDEPLGQTQSSLEDFRRGDMIDNDGDGFIDEEDEGIDDPSEFSIFQPLGNDRPFTTTDDVNQVAFMQNQNGTLPAGVQSPPPGLFNILADSVTIWNQSDEISGPLSGTGNEIAKINPNAANNWRPVDVWVRGGNLENRADVQYGPPVTLADLFPLQVDDDGDWNLNAEPDMASGDPNGIDDNGNGRVDEPSDDWDGNGFPSGDVDGYAEVDVGSPATLENGQDDDGDGNQFDEGRNNNVTVDRMLRLPRNEDDYDERPRDETDTQIVLGVVVEGDGRDNDGDNMIDDLGDFNGDGLLTYDPEWGVNEDPYGDGNGDGYPGLGGDIDAEDDTPEEDIIRDPRRRDDLVITSFADDDRDGAADFNDPQVLAAMYAPEMDGVDNDSDGEVDEIGERYIAAFDDDEDGRMDDDGPEFQLALNLYDYIDSWAPQLIANNEDVQDELGLNEEDAVIADPVTFQTVRLNSTRQRAFRMHPRLLVGPNRNSIDLNTFREEMRLLMPNPPQTNMEVTYEGVEAVRINEVMAKPVIRLEFEDALERITYNPADPTALPSIQPRRGAVNFGRRGSGLSDNGRLRGVDDTDWTGSYVLTTQQGGGAPQEQPFFTHTFLPNGFEHTYNPMLPFVNNDAKAPAFIFEVTNVAPDPADPSGTIGTEPETVQFVFNGIPSGIYDIVLYMHPNHTLQPEVSYSFNGKTIPMRSDTQVIDPSTNLPVPIANLPLPQQDVIRRDVGRLNGTYRERLTQGNAEPSLALPYRLSFWPGNIIDYGERFTDPEIGRVEVGPNKQLVITVTADVPSEDNPSRTHYVTSLDRIELINPFAQYVELVNISNDDLDLGGWQVTTPYGQYILPEETILPRMKPTSEEDDGRQRPTGEGLRGNGVPYENLLTGNQFGQRLNSEDLLIEDNKVLLAYNRELLIDFIEDNYPGVANLDDRVVEPFMVTEDREEIDSSRMTPLDPFASQNADELFRVFDIQQDVLTHNADPKMITLYDPAGNYQDSFRYRTTFNNEIAVITQINGVPLNNPTLRPDLIALPGYRGMETFERADPTHFENEMVVNAFNTNVEVERTVPSNIKLDVQDAILIDLFPRNGGGFDRGDIGGYVNRQQGQEQDFNQPTIQRFVDSNIPGFSREFKDSLWNGWDFVGDYYEYPSAGDRRDTAAITLMTNSGAMAREAVAPGGGPERVRFYDQLGGFENRANAIPNRPAYTAFVWRVGLRELIRAGYDPDVDDQLTVRVLGRQFIDDLGNRMPIDLHVGEVMVNPDALILNPGIRPLTRRPDYAANPENNLFTSQGRSVPVFSRLRNGDTAFSVNLREQVTALHNDLENDNDDEPTIEIMVVMRKTTRDMTVPFNPAAAIDGTLRPDLEIVDSLSSQPFYLPATDTNQDGVYRTVSGQNFVASVADDNYFFKGIELFGRGRSTTSGRAQVVDQFHRYLAGTPGRDNTGYVPGYPRRRLDLGGTSRDSLDLIDNTAFVKNGPLATVGEISRIFTGNKFETVSTPIIPQRLEDRATTRGRTFSNRDLGQRISGDNNEFRIQLAQRERLDQWEDRYALLYSMITTSMDGLGVGKININTAPREVLTALPAAPPTEPGEIPSLQDRFFFNSIVADFIIEGRQPTGRDQAFGVAEINDDLYRSQTVQTIAAPDLISEFKYFGTGREFRWFKDFDRIETLRLDRMGIEPEDVTGNDIDLGDYFLSTVVSPSDDGPYDTIGKLLTDILHMNRRERYSSIMRRAIDRSGDLRPESPGDLRERILAELSTQELTTEDMEALMNRVSNLITVRSRSFSIRSRGRVFDPDGNVVAERTLETVYGP